MSTFELRRLRYLLLLFSTRCLICANDRVAKFAGICTCMSLVVEKKNVVGPLRYRCTVGGGVLWSILCTARRKEYIESERTALVAAQVCRHHTTGIKGVEYLKCYWILIQIHYLRRGKRFSALSSELGSGRCAFIKTQAVSGTRSVFDQGSEDAALFTHPRVTSLPPRHLRKSSDTSFHVVLRVCFFL